MRGPIDWPAMLAMREVITTAERPATAELDDILDPRTLSARFDDGLCGAYSARTDGRWTTRAD